jgi:pimeloyl-ACP methyl ester carboxylesterase
MTVMPVFRAGDGTALAYHVQGDGAPLVCLPGGPMWDSVYLGDLGGLSAVRRLVMLDLRGTGQSAVPADPASYRCDRLVDDVAALQDHLGLDRMDLLGHSAGTSIAALYAARHPGRVSKLALVGPSTRAVGLDASSEMRREVVSLRRDEPWFAEAAAAFERIQAGGGTEDDWEAVTPFIYGRWDAAAQAHAAAGEEQVNREAAGVFGGPGAFDPEATRAGLAAFPWPVLVLAGEVDVNTVPRVAAEFAGLFPDARLVVQPGGGHYPWLDDPGLFTSAVAAFLDDGR